MDANPLNRPTADEISRILFRSYSEYYDQTELNKQIKEADEIYDNLPTNSKFSSII